MTPAKSAKILLVDDDVDICRNLHDILTDIGYQVDFAHDGTRAMELVRRTPYDVALLDLKMPGMDGVTLYRAIKKERSGTVAMLVSAFAGPETTEEALTAGAWKVLPKPVDLPRLLGLVEEALGQPLVLVVDDDRDLCGNLWDLLRERGYRVGLAHDAGQARERLLDSSYRIVLIDMRIPDGDGGAVFRMVRQSNVAARTILITGFRAEVDEMVDRVLAEGADAVCYKPFDVPRLLASLEGLLESHGQGRGDGARSST